MSTRNTTTYAEALVQAALGEWLDQLKTVQATLRRNPDVAALLTNPNSMPTDRESAIGRILPAQSAPQVRRFVQLLARDGEIDSLGEILRAVRGMVPAVGDQSSVVVTSAHQLSSNEMERLEAKLREDYGHDIRVDYDTDPDLLGGLRIRAGDRVIDHSVAARLEAMRQRLVS